jgi:hypothetical protein
VQVFQNNIMPANAAAWYMAKRKFYANQPLDHQLLAFLLKKYPDKFRLNKFKVGRNPRSSVPTRLPANR